MTESKSSESVRELRILRRLLAISGGVYLLWWFFVELLLPQSFNPLLSRLAVVALVLGAAGLSYFNSWVQRNLHFLFLASLWLITSHYYYLFAGNPGDINWIVGSYITVTAICFGFPTAFSLLAYSIFVLMLSVALTYLTPSMMHSVFLPGLATVLIQANVGFRARQGVQRTLAQSNARFQMLFASTFEGIMVHQHGRVTDVNEALAKMLGYARQELIGVSPMVVIHPAERPSVAERMAESDVGPYETRGLRKDGSALEIEVRAKDFRYGRQIARLVTVQSVADRKKAEKEKVAALTLAENVRVRDEFISIASHELKTPITSLKLQTQLMERELKRNAGAPTSAESMQDFVGVFNRQINRLIELVETMLDVSRISAGRLELNREDVDLGSLVREVIHDLTLGDTSARWTVDASPGARVYGDRSRLRQVIENLATNAVKYGEGRPLAVRVRGDSKNIWIEFEDHGIGIAPEYTSRIFDRFERAISSQNISGLGLGLYIARQIAEAHEGLISVRSELGQGSIFTVMLPAFT